MGSRLHADHWISLFLERPNCTLCPETSKYIQRTEGFDFLMVDMQKRENAMHQAHIVGM